MKKKFNLFSATWTILSMIAKYGALIMVIVKVAEYAMDQLSQVKGFQVPEQTPLENNGQTVDTR